MSELKPVIPKLSTTSSIVSNNESILIDVYNYFITLLKAENNMFSDTAPSLRYIINNYKSSDDLREHIIRDFKYALNYYFTDVTVTVDIATIDDTEIRSIAIEAVVNVNNQQYRLQRDLSIDDGIIKMRHRDEY